MYLVTRLLTLPIWHSPCNLASGEESTHLDFVGCTNAPAVMELRSYGMSAMPMSATQMLKQDHDHVKSLFHEYEAGGWRDPQEKQRIVQQVCRELQIHSQLEKEIFYPAIQSGGNEWARELVTHGLEEHRMIDDLVHQLKQMEPQNLDIDGRMRMLMQYVNDHVQEEEHALFPQVEQSLASRLPQLAQELQQRKQQLMASVR